ncbi:DinB family protein [Deinococcus petrolearius]|uniref:DinB family protein n=1 Tax=Deinococcus petrolearius TaxID=1751295 RepID=A0ABW1DFY0_9DEIO
MTTLQDASVLRAMGETPDEVRARLSTELERFEAQLRRRRGDWTRPQPGRDWSPAQEAEHVLLIDTGVMRILGLLLSGREVQPMPQVPGALKGGKRQSPASAVPSAEGLAWDTWEARWAEHRAALEQVAAGVRQTPDRTFWHPFFGELDALDWLRMVVGHARSHRKLLERSAAEAGA